MPSPPHSAREGKQKLTLVRDGHVAAPQVVRARPRPERPATPLQPGQVEEAFRALAEKIASGTDGGDPEGAALGVVQRLAGCRACFVVRDDAEKQRLLVSTVRGRNDERITAVGHGEGPAGRAFSARRVEREPGVAAAPLGAGGTVTGCLVLLSPRFAVSDDLMAALAAHVSAAGQVARLRDDGARRTKDLQTAVAGLRGLEKTREDLLANVSHDLKNPLTAVKAYLDMLSRPRMGELNARQSEAVEACRRNVDRLVRMINELLLVSRLQSGRMELADRPFGLKGVADEATRSLAAVAAQAKVKLRVAPSAEVFVRGDRPRVLEAVYALAENGVHRCRANGSVEVAISTSGPELARLTVRDDGPGMGENELKHLFDTFHRSSWRGRRSHAGLGLALAAKIAHLHGGRIEAESQKGEGSRLAIYLPMFAGPLSAPTADAMPRDGGILVVEDEPDCRDVLCQVLEMEGYRVTATGSASDARALLAEARPAAVLLDLRLAEEDGRAVLHHIRETPYLADVAVYLISGARDLASLSEGRGIDRIDGFFEKPLHLPRVLDTLATVVRPTGPLDPAD